MTSPPGAFSSRVTSDSDSDSFNHGRFAPGTRIGDRYRIVGRLGVGGMGEVYRADDLKLGQAVALKFLPEAVERDPVRLDKLNAEIRTARQISHPNVCRVYDLGEVDGRRFLTMEYVDGEDLSGLLRRIGRLPEDKGLEIARQICAGLAAIHDRGVLHRDLKPANVMLDGRGRVRLTDFGLSTTAAAAAREGEIAGTPAYMAPEQLAGEPLSVATDLYALGLLLFELFTGERVHKHDRLQEARAGKRPSAGSVSLTTSGSGAKLDPVIQRVIERCLDTDPKRRPQSAIAIAAALPGGDPLAAALAAGETPSPQMVAAAGSEGGLSFKVAVPLLAALLVGAGLLLSLRGQTALTSMIKVEIPPEVLTSKASEMLVRLGYVENVADAAAGFSVSSSQYAQWVRRRDSSASRWQHAGAVRPALLYFWRRTSPHEMVPTGFFGQRPGGGIAVGPADPPVDSSGMTYLELDPEGRMIWFKAVPPIKHSESPADPSPDWAPFFLEAGLDLAKFRPVEPVWSTPNDSDARGAWLGPGAHPAGEELRVEAATLNKRLVSFRLLAPWIQLDSAPAIADGEAVAGYVVVGLLLVLPVVAIGLSIRNLRLGRSDARGALRLAAVVGGLVFVGSVLGSTLTTGLGLVQGFAMLASWAGLSALLTAAFYMALEPVARRHWPKMLIAWSRLLDGRWRDPLVGRSLLVGCVLALCTGLANEFKMSRGQDLELIWRLLDTAGWMRATDPVAELLKIVGFVLVPSLGMVMLLVVLRIVLRREWAAAVVFFVLFAGLNMAVQTEVSLPAKVAFALLVASVHVLVLTRFGLVAFVAFTFTGRVMVVTQGLATPEFATGALVLYVGGALAPGLFGFYTATRGRKASAWLDG